MNAQRPDQGKVDPAVYLRLRENALKPRPSHLPEDAIQVILMDWHVPNGTFTVLAAVDGTASLYLSSGGGRLGGGQRHARLNQQAKQAVALTQVMLAEFRPTATYPLPVPGSVSFYAATSSEMYVAVALEEDLKFAMSPLRALATLMHAIVTSYRELPMTEPRTAALN